MKEYIVDANVIFSSLISGKEQYLRLFATYKFFVPDFTMNEIQKYQELLLKKTKLQPDQIRDFTLSLFSNLTVVPNFLISTNAYLTAFQLCKNVDEKDTPYIALSLEFDLVFVTKDDELVAGLRQKGFEKILSFREFIEQLEAE